MNFSKTFLVAVLFVLLGSFNVEAHRILFIPMDNRPVCLDYTVDTSEKAGWEVIVPPYEYIASRYNLGEPDKLLEWFEKQAPTANAAVISTDALIYGGLVSSRTHNFPIETLLARYEKIIDIKRNHLNLRLYGFSTIMRTPKASSGGVEPPYYEVWGPDIFRLSVLEDKEDIVGLDKAEEDEKCALLKKIPSEVRSDWLNRRAKNVQINAKLIESAILGDFSYFVMGKDDTAVYSQSHKESLELEKITEGKNIYNYKMFVGADQLGLVLLARTVKDYTYEIPFVYVKYADGVGDKTIPSYEDTYVGNTVKAHILASGGFPVKSDKRADIILFVNTPFDGITKEASSQFNNYEKDEKTINFLNEIDLATKKDVIVSVADIAFGNGSSNALVSGLMDKNLSYKVDSYAGWNTASNTIGYAIAQGELSKYMTYEDKTKLLTLRYLDEWGYQANIRGSLYEKIVWPQNINGTDLGEKKALLVNNAKYDLINLFNKYDSNNLYLENLDVDFPWNRMFEIKIVL